MLPFFPFGDRLGGVREGWKLSLTLKIQPSKLPNDPSAHYLESDTSSQCGVVLAALKTKKESLPLWTLLTFPFSYFFQLPHAQEKMASTFYSLRTLRFSDNPHMQKKKKKMPNSKLKKSDFNSGTPPRAIFVRISPIIVLPTFDFDHHLLLRSAWVYLKHVLS